MRRQRRKRPTSTKTEQGEQTFFPAVQKKLSIGRADDAYEKEADNVADKVVSKGEPGGVIQKMGAADEEVQEKPIGESISSVQKKDMPQEEESVQKMEEEETVQQQEEEETVQQQEEEETVQQQEEEEAVQTKANGGLPAGQSIESRLKSSKGQGQKMNKSTQSEMEAGFGVNFNDVNIHTGSEAQSMSKALGAQAFTNGKDVYFNQGKYNPNSTEGKHLLAHELTHTIQQAGSEPQKVQKESSNQVVQRKLKVKDEYPKDYIDKFQQDPKGEDPSKKLSNKDRHNLVKGQLAKISPEFSVKASGEVEASHSKKEEELTKGSKGTGSCCMHVLTRPKAKDWEILVADHLFPHTNDKKFKVLINSNLTPVEAGAHTKKGKKKLYTSNPEVVLGHELCGHAALMEIEAHAEGKRAVTNVHDSTINIENEIAKSVGIKDDELRGLASDGPHKGESFGKSVVINFGFNKVSVYKLDQTERDKLNLIADLVKVFDMFVELRGHSDNVGSEAAKQNISDRRAKNVYHYLRNLGVSRKAKVEIDDDNSINVNRFLLKGMSDKEPVADFDPQTEQHKLRRVDVTLASYPAGLSELPPGISKKKKKLLEKHDKVKEPKKVQELIDNGTPCEKLLVEKAWRKK